MNRRRPVTTGPRRELLVRLTLVVFSLLLGCGLSEVLARWIYAQERAVAEGADYTRLYQADPVLEWTHVSGDTLVVDTDDGPVSIEINSHGLRDREYPYEKRPGTFRILVLGDSFTEAFQVNLDSTYHSIVEQRLNEDDGLEGLRFEVISAGIAGYGVAREMVFYEEEGRKYQPDLVILAYYIGNDVQDDNPALAEYEVFPGIFREQFFELDSEGRLQEVVLDAQPGIPSGARQAEVQAVSLLNRVDAWLFGRSRLYFYVRPFAAEQLPPVRSLLYQAGFVNTPVPMVPRFSAGNRAFESGWVIEEALFDRLRKAVEDDGARLAVIIIPDPIQVQPEMLRERYPLFYPDLLQYMDLELPDRTLICILGRHDTPYLYLAPAFQVQQASQGARLYGASSHHWTVAGHALAADEVYEWLLSEGLVSAHRD